MSTGPINEKDLTCVGVGWKSLLETLNSFMKDRLDDAKRHGSGEVKEEYRDKSCREDASIEILQIKEKFGGLRVYWRGKGLGDRLWNQVAGAVGIAESLSYLICEKCGSQEGVETRTRDGQKFGRVLTLCGEHHKERENLPPGEWFDLGHEQKTV